MLRGYNENLALLTFPNMSMYSKPKIVKSFIILVPKLASILHFVISSKLFNGINIIIIINKNLK
jgi:hypothetical protein